jgi:hypothetical protein
MTGGSTVYAKGPWFQTTREAVAYAKKENPGREAAGKQPYTAICQFSASGRKVDTIFLSDWEEAGPAEERLEGPATSFQGNRQTKYGDLQVNVFSATSNVVRELPLRTNEYNGSPTGFECGYCGAGPHQLAYSMLRECGFDKKHALLVNHGVVLGVVAKLPREGTWTVTREQVLEAAESYRKSFVAQTLFE